MSKKIESQNLGSLAFKKPHHSGDDATVLTTQRTLKVTTQKHSTSQNDPDYEPEDGSKMSKKKKTTTKNQISEHEAKVFELSKQVWGDGGVHAAHEGDGHEDTNEDAEEEDVYDKYPYLCGALESFESPFPVEEAIRFIDSAKRKEVEMKWKLLHLKEEKLLRKKSRLNSMFTEIALHDSEND